VLAKKEQPVALIDNPLLIPKQSSRQPINFPEIKKDKE
jgi:hypothetical protein